MKEKTALAAPGLPQLGLRRANFRGSHNKFQSMSSAVLRSVEVLFFAHREPTARHE